MKIVHVTHLYHPSQGGVQISFKKMSERLVRDYGDDVTVVTTNSYYGPDRKVFKEIKPSTEIINGVKVVRFPFRRWHITPFSFLYRICTALGLKYPEWMRFQSYGPYSPEMKKYLLDLEADAYCGASTNYYFMQLPLWKKCNFFYYGCLHLHEDATKDKLYETQLQSINASTMYIANTHFEKERVIAMGVKPGNVFVLGVGVDMEPFALVGHDAVRTYKAEIGIPADAVVVGYVGRVEPTKGVKTLIDAFVKIAVSFPHVHLLIAGSGGQYAENLKSNCSSFDISISKRIHWQLNFPAEKKPVLFNTLDILVLPSKNESFGIVFLEAWCCKKPVIGTAIGAVKDVITEGKDGLIMEVESSNSLAEKLATLISDYKLRKDMGENGFQKVKENFTWDIIVARLRQCYVNANKKESKPQAEKRLSYV